MTMTARLRRLFNRVNYSLLHFCSWLTRRLPRRSRYSTLERSQPRPAATALLPAEVPGISTALPIPHLDPSSVPPAAPASVIPELDRSSLVVALLDEAWSQGRTTYPQLIAYVRQQSGAGCSKRTIANWKRLRGLLDETV